MTTTTIVYQNLVSCETTTTLKLKVMSQPPHSPSTIDLCFLNPTPRNKPSYVHPLDKKSSFSRRLSEKSLELCTENLGSESGSDILTTDDITFLSSSYNKRREHKAKQNESKKIKNFPPPLTTMSGASSMQVRRRSEGGRLIIEAVEAPFRNSYLQAERSDGRLKLCFLRPGKVQNDDGNDDVIDEVKMEMGIDKFQRMTRCNSNTNGDQGLCRDNWKPAALWVASS